ncbi:MAG: tRNA threonylcarbamoyladenosine dehydratase [Clostridia bacterium]|nr:tRNA threonylcarbamoyladenosine dehydratase [Clostridia bacterium]
MSEQFSRTVNLLHEEGFSRLQGARVAVFGVGGVGGYVCEALVRSGIGEIDVFDNDTVSLSNLNRQIIALHSTIGQDKVTVMASRLRDINPDVIVHEHRMFYLPENADAIDLTPYDFVVDAVDTVAAKVELALRCDRACIPFISAMGAGNKLDPSHLRIADIYDTSVCPLARVMRTICRKKGIRRMTVAYSTEEPVRPAVVADAEDGRRKDIPASMAFVPSAMGLLIASHVVRKIALDK